MADLGPRPFRLGALWILLLAILVAALPALRGQLLSYDDRALLLGPDGAAERSFASFFSGTYYYAYLPFYGLSYWIECRIAGVAPWIFHLGNVLWHAATCYVVFCLLGLLLRDRVAALLAALLFALHPLHVESVAWISGRKELVSGFFLFLAWLWHVRREDRPGLGFLIAIPIFLVACFAKATAIVLPGLLFAAALLLPRYAGARRRALLRALPMAVAALLPLAVHLLVGVEKGVVREAGEVGGRALAGLAAFGNSLRRALLPIGLAIDYPEARRVALSDLLGPGALLMGAVATALFLRRRAPAASCGIAAFFVALLPFNNVFPATEILAADRYLYLPLFGLALAAGAYLVDRHDAKVAAGALCLVYAALSFLGSSRFADDETLWSRTLEARPDSALAYLQRGFSRSERGLLAAPQDPRLIASAVEDFEKGLLRAPLAEMEAKANAALILPLLALGRAGEAIERADRALALVAGKETADARQFRAEALHHRGLARTALGDDAGAARDHAASFGAGERYEASYEAGRALMRAGAAAEALAFYRKAAERAPKAADPWIEMVPAFRALGDRDGYARAIDEAARRAPAREEIVALRVNFHLDAHPPEWRKAEEELARLPAESRGRRRLACEIESYRALYHFRQGQDDLALAAALRAIDGGDLDRRNYYELGQVFLKARRYDEAIRCFRGAADRLAPLPAHRDAIARACMLKANQLSRTDPEGALLAARAALDVQPDLIDAGGGALRGEVAMLRETRRDPILVLAVAVVAGDSARAGRLAADLLQSGEEGKDRLLVYRLRALLQMFVTFDFRGAEDDLRQILAAAPQDRWARYRLAEAWARSGSAWLVTADQIRSPARREEGEALLDRAIGLLTELLAEDPDFHVARLQRGEAHFARGDMIGAKADYSYVRDREGRLKEVYVKEAVLHRLVYVRGGERANLEAALPILDRALGLDPNYFDALFEAGNAYHLLYDRQEDPSAARRTAFNQAILWYRRAMAIDPSRKEPRLEWARLCLKAMQEAVAGGKIAQAHELLQRAESEAPDVVDVHRERVLLAMRPDFGEQVGLAPDAVFALGKNALDAIERQAPETPDLPLLRSLYHRRRGYSFYWSWVKLRDTPKRDRARELAASEWALALKTAPDDPENAAVRDRLREIAPEFIDHDKARAEEAYRRGVEQYGKGLFREAADAFEEAVRLFPESSGLRFYLGMASARAGRLDRARRELEQVANGPDGQEYPDALYELGNLSLVQRERMTAKAWYKRYVTLMEEEGRGEEESVRHARREMDSGER